MYFNWIKRIIKSCTKVTQLDSTLNLIESYKRINATSPTLETEVNKLQRFYQKTKKLIKSKS